MKTLLFTLKTLCLSILLSGISILHSMENDGSRSDSGRIWEWDVSNNRFKKKPKPASAEELKKYTEDAQDALEYNNTLCPLTATLTNDALCEVFSRCHTQGNNEVDSLEKSMKNFIKISGVCKNFNHILSPQNIGEFCKQYNPETKNDMLLKIVQTMYKGSYMKLPALILVFGEADTNITGSFGNCLMESAISNNDLEFAKVLCDHKANPHVQNTLGYIFFYTKTKAMTKLLVAHGLDVHATNGPWSRQPNVLWEIANGERPSELMSYYLELGVNPQIMWNDNCLLHRFASPHSSVIKDIDNFLRKAKLLLNAIPEMINLPDKRNNTPLDLAYKSFDDAKKCGGTQKAFEKLIALFREHGALTAQELAQLKANQQ